MLRTAEKFPIAEENSLCSLVPLEWRYCLEPTCVVMVGAAFCEKPATFHFISLSSLMSLEQSSGGRGVQVLDPRDLLALPIPQAQLTAIYEFFTNRLVSRHFLSTCASWHRPRAHIVNRLTCSSCLLRGLQDSSDSFIGRCDDVVEATSHHKLRYTELKRLTTFPIRLHSNRDWFEYTMSS